MVQVPLLLCSSECCEAVSFAVLASHHACHDEHAPAHHAVCEHHHGHHHAPASDEARDEAPDCGTHLLYFVSCLTSAPAVDVPAPARVNGGVALFDLLPPATLAAGLLEGRWPIGDVPEACPPPGDPVRSADRLLL